MLSDRVLTSMNFFFVVNYDSIRSLRVQVVVKNILLHNSTHSLISAVWKSSFIMHIHDLADMGIYGKSIHMMQCKQADTLCYLFSNATEFHQFFLCLMVTHIIDFFQGDFAGCDSPGCHCDIFCPISKAAVS